MNPSYLVDSDWLVDVLVGVAAASRTLIRLTNDGIAVSIVSYGELFEGAVRSADPTTEFARIRTLLARFSTLPLTDPVMEIFARTRADLRGQGMIIADLDLLIAATALAHDLTLLTRNRRHFDRVAGLKIYEAA